MASIKCGHCKGTHSSVDEVRACANGGTVLTAEKPDEDLTVANWANVDKLRSAVARHLVREERGKLVGYYAVRDEDLIVKFYRVKRILHGKWAGKVFVDVQASDEFYPVRKCGTLTAVLGTIANDPDAAAKLYSDKLGRCCRCRRTLTDETSRALGIGPECIKK